MNILSENMDEYRKQMKKGVIQQAYKGLLEYIMSLRTDFKNRYPEYFVPANVYMGYMDMTYFSLVPKELKYRKLKVAIVFIHNTCSFEVWLAGTNKQVQNKYWQLFKESDWNIYHLVSTTKGNDAIVDHVIVAEPNFNDLETLTQEIERETLKFIHDVEGFLSFRRAD